MFKIPGWVKSGLLWALGIGALYLFARFLLPFVLPFLIGLCLARLMENSVRALHARLRFPRPLGAGIMTALLVGFLLTVCTLIVSRLVREAAGLLERMPEFAQQWPALAASWEARVRVWIGAAPLSLREILENSLDKLMREGIAIPESVSGGLLRGITDWAAALPSQILFLCAVVLSTYLLSSDYPNWIGLMLRPFSHKQQQWILQTQSRVFVTLGKWVRAQGMMMAITFGILCFGFLLMGLQAVLLPALLIALLDALPVLGAGLCLIPWSLYSFATGETQTAIGLLIVYGVVVLSRGVIEPKLVGAQIGMRALPTFMAMYIGFKAFGVVGMVVCPILAITVKQIRDSARATDTQKKIHL